MDTPWEVALAATATATRRPAKLRASKLFHVTRTETDELVERRELPHVTIVEVAKQADPEDIKRIAAKLAGKPAARGSAGFVIFALEGNPKRLPEWDVDLVRPFQRPERI